ncbi:MAG: hypothetical protein ISQ14_03920 [Verrucomicrobiae bacterium]|jgi:polyhydroxyalkanoate synthesis regulator phasin|nr:hypothetical protein [Verrucomicrobiae bacterium]
MGPDSVNFETINLIRQITADGKLEIEEVWDLAEYLNNNAKARKSWPGKRLWKVIQQVFEDNKVTEEEMHMLGKEIADIEEICSEIMEEEQAPEPDEDRPPIDVTTLSLPSIEKTVYVHPRNDDKRLFASNLRDHSCTCEDWCETHHDLPSGSIGRLCKHLVDAMKEAHEDPKADTEDWLESLTDLIFILARLQLPAKPLTIWEHLEWDGHNAYVAYGESQWATVIANVGGRSYEHYGFNLVDSRWSYGTEPPDAQIIAQHLLEHSAYKPTGDTVDVTPRSDPEALTLQE